MLAVVGLVVTVAAADVGLQVALQLWDDYVAAEVCPAPEAAAARSPPTPVFEEAPRKDIRVKFLSIRDDAVDIDVRGERIQLAGYPPPRSGHHGPSALTTAVVSADGEQIAIAGSCWGDSGSEFRLPSCAPKFVRIYQVIDGMHIRDLRVPWGITDDERRVLAMAFDESGARLAVLVRAAWSDCSWAGAGVELIVYWVGDGTRLVRRVLEINDEGGARHMTFELDEVRVVTTRPHRKDAVRVVQLEPAFFEDCM
jgi:hypothetical protein